ncbi:hypothetical protein FACS189488_07540 [Betaproteobacteria bacterium]|nr:hypothetical protein FACS189488_07540 [Betaproteobacteria bacterium]
MNKITTWRNWKVVWCQRKAHKNADAKAAVAHMKKFMQEAPTQGVDIQALIREGRA